MASWHNDEIEDLLGLDELDARISGEKREDVRNARVLAFLLRRRLTRAVPQFASKEEKKAILAEKRFANRLARKLIVSAKRGKDVEYDTKALKNALIARYKPSLLLDSLVSNRERRWVSMGKRLRSRERSSIEVEDFSFLAHPNKTLKLLREIAEQEASLLSSQIHFLDRECMDIGSWLILAAMRQDMAPIFTGGAISSELIKVLTALEMTSALRMKLPTPEEDEINEAEEVWAFPLRARRPAGSSTSATQFLDPQDAEEVATDLCEAINSWLAECAGQSLNLDGRRNVMQLVTETLDNAERHSRPEYENDGDWMMTGFMAVSGPESERRFRCQLALLSVGSPISETVQQCDIATSQKMESYVKTHRSKFSKLRHRDQHLRTIYALQDFVSRDRNAYENERGGTGFSDIIRVFTDLSGHENPEVFARLAVVSGHTCLHLSWEDCDRAMTQSLGKPFNIWLNDEHSDVIPPRADSIVELETELRGTLITMCFEFDTDYLERTHDGTN
nr:hypothetical protein [uncultured Celeribacter sp.]